MNEQILSEVGIRFAVGGIIICLFSALGDIFSPKSFAGLFSASPSVALATLGLTLAKHGGGYAAVEGRSMIVGAIALFAFSLVTSWLLMRKKWSCIPASIAALFLWFGIAFGLWFVGVRPYV